MVFSALFSGYVSWHRLVLLMFQPKTRVMLPLTGHQAPRGAPVLSSFAAGMGPHEWVLSAPEPEE